MSPEPILSRERWTWIPSAPQTCLEVVVNLLQLLEMLREAPKTSTAISLRSVPARATNSRNPMAIPEIEGFRAASPGPPDIARPRRRPPVKGGPRPVRHAVFGPAPSARDRSGSWSSPRPEILRPHALQPLPQPLDLRADRARRDPQRLRDLRDRPLGAQHPDHDGLTLRKVTQPGLQ